MTDAFEGFLAPPPHAHTKAAKATAANPLSQYADDPYLDLDAEGIAPFRVEDKESAVFGPGDIIEVHEITHSLRLGTIGGYGYRVLRSGGLSVRGGIRVALAWSDIPEPLHERLRP